MRVHPLPPRKRKDEAKLRGMDPPANQPKLWEEIRWFFEALEGEKDVQEGFADHEHTVDKDHGRLEIRDYYISEEIDWLKPALADWTKPRVSAWW